MDALVFVCVAVVAAVLVGVVVGFAVARAVARSVASSASGQLRHQAAAEREAMVRAAVDTVVAVAGDRLGAQAEAGSRELRTRHEQFDQRVGEVRGELARVAELMAGLQRDRAEQQGRVETRLAEVADCFR